MRRHDLVGPHARPARLRGVLVPSARVDRREAASHRERARVRRSRARLRRARERLRGASARHRDVACATTRRPSSRSRWRAGKNSRDACSPFSIPSSGIRRRARRQIAALIGALALIADPGRRSGARAARSWSDHATQARGSRPKVAVVAERLHPQVQRQRTRMRVRRRRHQDHINIADQHRDRRAELADSTARPTQPSTAIRSRRPSATMSTYCHAGARRLCDSSRAADGPAECRARDDRPCCSRMFSRPMPTASLRRVAAWGLSEYADQDIASEALNACARDGEGACARWPPGPWRGDRSR